MPFISYVENDTTDNTILENFSEFWCRLNLRIKIVNRNVRNSEFTRYLAPRFLRKNMEEYSLHENKRREFLRDKSRPFTHARNTIVISRFYVLKANKPHEKRIARIERIARCYSTVTLFARFCGLSISRPSFLAIPTATSQRGMSGRNGERRWWDVGTSMRSS